MSSKGGRGLTRKGSILEETLDGVVQSEVGQGSPEGLREGSRVLTYLDLVDQNEAGGASWEVNLPDILSENLSGKRFGNRDFQVVRITNRSESNQPVEVGNWACTVGSTKPLEPASPERGVVADPVRVFPAE